MKKLIVIFLIIVQIISISACTVTENDNNNNDTNNGATPDETLVTLSGKIMDINETTLLVANIADDANDGDIYWVNVDNDELNPGMFIDITYDGVIQESFPMGLGEVNGISIKEQGEDIAGLYIKVINDLYEVDPGLNDGIERLAFDFSKVTNLTKAEKTALTYMIGNLYNIETIRGTYDELCEQGYIDKEKMYFETGLLFSIEDTVIEGKKFKFNAQKWRSGLGAYFFHDCSAKKVDGDWVYTIGAEMIS